MISQNHPIFNKFDSIFLITSHTTRNRIPAVTAELNRVGINSFSKYIDFPSPFFKILRQSINKWFSPYLKTSPTHWNVTLAHYLVVAQAYYLGAEHALFMEDDVRFLKDPNILYNALEQLPDAYMIALLDHSYAEVSINQYNNFFKREFSSPWTHFPNFPLRCATAYALSRDGMQKFIRLLDSSRPLRHNDYFFSTQFFPKEYSYVATPPVAIQKIPDKFDKVNNPTNSNLNALKQYHIYRNRLFNNLDMYNI